MAEDNRDRATEREADIAAELQRIGQNPNQVDEGSDSLGTQSTESGSPREGADEPEDDAATSQEEARELPDEQQTEQWAESSGDGELAEEAVGDDS